jgi:hypothetical protein
MQSCGLGRTGESSKPLVHLRPPNANCPGMNMEGVGNSSCGSGHPNPTQRRSDPNDTRSTLRFTATPPAIPPKISPIDTPLPTATPGAAIWFPSARHHARQNTPRASHPWISGGARATANSCACQLRMAVAPNHHGRFSRTESTRSPQPFTNLAGRPSNRHRSPPPSMAQ